jgi:D-glycero-alpha-D-manno-heptose 1-phosphate guanylyltransferase
MIFDMKEITEAIILAGGLGTRLSSVVPGIPKCMAPVNGKPFIAYVIEYLHKQGIEKFIFALGYKHKTIVEYLESFTIDHSSFTIQYSIENEPLGTGGAIKFGCTHINTKNVFVANGDTLFKVNLKQLSDFHNSNKAHCTLSLKQMRSSHRYGTVELNKDSSIRKFNEKKYNDEGLINGGSYVLDTEKFSEENLPQKFSFEKNYLEKMYNQRRMYGIIQDEYFIDIGIPEDYARTQLEIGTGTSLLVKKNNNDKL